MTKNVSGTSILEDIASGKIVPVDANHYQQIKQVFLELAALQPQQFENKDIESGFMIALKIVQDILDRNLSNKKTEEPTHVIKKSYLN
jgi:hypothetical protein